MRSAGWSGSIGTYAPPALRDRVHADQQVDANAASPAPPAISGPTPRSIRMPGQPVHPRRRTPRSVSDSPSNTQGDRRPGSRGHLGVEQCRPACVSGTRPRRCRSSAENRELALVGAEQRMSPTAVAAGPRRRRRAPGGTGPRIAATVARVEQVGGVGELGRDARRRTLSSSCRPTISCRSNLAISHPRPRARGDGQSGQFQRRPAPCSGTRAPPGTAGGGPVERVGLSTSTSRSNGTSACANAARSVSRTRVEQLGRTSRPRRPAVAQHEGVDEHADQVVERAPRHGRRPGCRS